MECTIFERRENVLLDVLLERLPAHPLHDVTGDAHPVIGVGRNGARSKYPFRLVADEKVAQGYRPASDSVTMMSRTSSSNPPVWVIRLRKVMGLENAGRIWKSR